LELGPEVLDLAWIGYFGSELTGGRQGGTRGIVMCAARKNLTTRNIS